MQFPVPLSLSFIGHCAVWAAFSTFVYSDIVFYTMASCHQFVTSDPGNCGIFLDLTL